jgi:uncharacterized membrane protein
LPKNLSGGLPAATELERLEKLAPGTTDRMLRLAEQQQKHRHDWENTALSIHAEERKRSNLYAFLFSVAALICSFGLGYMGQPTAASVIGGGTIATVVTAFVVGSKGKPSSGEVKIPQHGVA